MEASLKAFVMYILRDQAPWYLIELLQGTFFISIFHPKLSYQIYFHKILHCLYFSLLKKYSKAAHYLENRIQFLSQLLKDLCWQYCPAQRWLWNTLRISHASLFPWLMVVLLREYGASFHLLCPSFEACLQHCLLMKVFTLNLGICSQKCASP